MFMEGVARHTDRILPTADFYAAAANGSLPEFSWVRWPPPARPRAASRASGRVVVRR